jgi:hypothetical protein
MATGPLASPAARLVAGGGTGGAVGLWDGGSAEQVALLQGHARRAVTALAFGPAGHTLFTGGRGQAALHCWDVRAVGRGVVWSVARDGCGTAQRLGIGLTPDGGALLAGGRGGCVRVWDARTGEALLGEGGWDVAAGCGRGGGGGGGAGRAVSGVAVHPTAPVVAAAVGGRVGWLEGGGEAGEEEGAAPPAWNGVSFWGVASAWTAL